MRVRQAEQGDVEWLLGELRQFAAAVGGKHALFSEDYARAWIPRLIAEHFVRIAHRAEERAGLIVGLVGTHPLNPNLRTLSELFWWVAVAHRRSRAAVMLLDALVAWGREHVDLITLTVEAASPLKATALARWGFRLQEFGYMAEI